MTLKEEIIATIKRTANCCVHSGIVLNPEDVADEIIELLQQGEKQPEPEEVNNCKHCGSDRLFRLTPHNASCYDCDQITDNT